MIINLNAGHGPNDVRGFLPVDKLNECSEGQNNFRIYELVRKGLQQYADVTVTTARPAMGDNPGLTTRGLSGKGADLQIHLHSNAGGGKGPEILLRPDASDSAVSLAKDIRKCIQAVGNLAFRPLKFPVPDGKSGTDWKLTRGSGTSYFAELRYSEAKDVLLVEMAFHDNATEARILRTKRQEIADAIVGAIVAHYKLQKPAPKQDPINGPYINDNGERLYFRAVAGSYPTRKEAQDEVARLKAAGNTGAWLQAVYVKETK